MRSRVAQARGLESVRSSDWQGYLRSVIFFCGDGLFLLLVSSVVTLTMHLIHRLGWNFALTLLAGMAVAMVVQTLLATAIAPILGSIESMVPSMVVAMASPMALCTLDLIGIGLSGEQSLWIGVTMGIGSFLLIEAYGRRCKKALCRTFPGK